MINSASVERKSHSGFCTEMRQRSAKPRAPLYLQCQDLKAQALRAHNRP
jgi:hypothetical protein